MVVVMVIADLVSTGGVDALILRACEAPCQAIDGDVSNLYLVSSIDFCSC